MAVEQGPLNIGNPAKQADICLILEGTYPYVSGGVSSWTHELLQAHPERMFHLISIIPPGAKTIPYFQLPNNVVSLQTLTIQVIPQGKRVGEVKQKELVEKLKPLIIEMLTGDNPEQFDKLIKLFTANQDWVGSRNLVHSSAVWSFILELYDLLFSGGGFLDFFWSLTVLMKSLYSVLLFPLPNAKVFHSLSTGYAGLFLARAKTEKKSPCILTEHGLYTNERRIEISVADWLSNPESLDLTFDQKNLTLRDYWLNVFLYFSKVCYVHCDEIVTLFAANQDVQLEGGASYEQLSIISNGVDVEKFQNLKKERTDERTTIALIGRVVPIKDIKTFIRAASFIRQHIPNVNVLILGPQDEDPEYVEECIELVKEMDLQDNVHLLGKVNVEEYYPSIDLLVLTSVSESQPLVILEAGAAGIPVVATNVGACQELIYGKKTELPPLGEGGKLVSLADPESVADGCLSLLLNPDRYYACSQAIKARMEQYYRKEEQHQGYSNLYKKYLGKA